MALSDAAIGDIETLKQRYPDIAAAILPSLYIAQRETGMIDDDAVRTVASALQMEPIRVREVATWYTMYHKKTIGRHLVEVCTNLSCHINGGQELLEHLCKELGVRPGSTTEDGRFTLREVECLGSCGTAPAMQVDGVFHENLTAEKASAVLRAAD